jgi:hypothetical protein
LCLGFGATFPGILAALAALLMMSPAALTGAFAGALAAALAAAFVAALAAGLTD